jgi:type IV pilus assembly protein PilE
MKRSAGEGVMKSRQKGLTLIELMVVIAVIAILASIAYPAYQDQVGKSRRAAAKGNLLELAQFMERNYTEANRYDQDPDGNAIDNDALPFNVSPKNGTVYYNLTVTVSGTPNSSYELSAVPAGSQTDDECGTLTVDNTGDRTAAIVGCW